MLYNVPLCKVKGGGGDGQARGCGAVAQPLPEENRGCLQRPGCLLLRAERSSDAQQPGGTERLSSITSELQPEPPVTKPGTYRPLPCSHPASRNHHLGAAHRAGLIPPHSLLTIAGGTRGGEAFRASKPWHQGYLLPSCNISPPL